MFRNGNMAVQNIIDTEASRVCRLCLAEEENMVCIFDPRGHQGFLLWEIIKELLQMEVSKEDGLPGTICGGCINRVRDFKSFKTVCIRAKISFLTMIARRGMLSGMATRPSQSAKADTASVFPEAPMSQTSAQDSADEVEVVEIIDDDLQVVTLDQPPSPAVTGKRKRAIARKSPPTLRSKRKPSAVADVIEVIDRVVLDMEGTKGESSTSLNVTNNLPVKKTSAVNANPAGNNPMDMVKTTKISRKESQTKDAEGSNGGSKRDECIMHKMKDKGNSVCSEKRSKEGQKTTVEKKVKTTKISRKESQTKDVEGSNGGSELDECIMHKMKDKGNSVCSEKRSKEGQKTTVVKKGKKIRSLKERKPPTKEPSAQTGTEVNFIAVPVAENREVEMDCGEAVDPLAVIKEERVEVDSPSVASPEGSGDIKESIEPVPSNFSGTTQLSVDVGDSLKMEPGVVDNPDCGDADSPIGSANLMEVPTDDESDTVMELEMDFEEAKLSLVFPEGEMARNDHLNMDCHRENQNGTPGRNLDKLDGRQEESARASPTEEPVAAMNFISVSVPNVDMEEEEAVEEDPLAISIGYNGLKEIDTITLDDDDEDPAPIMELEMEGCALRLVQNAVSLNGNRPGDNSEVIQGVSPQLKMREHEEGVEKQCGREGNSSIDRRANLSPAPETRKPSSSCEKPPQDGSHPLNVVVDVGHGQVKGVRPDAVLEKDIPASSPKECGDLVRGINSACPTSTALLQDLNAELVAEKIVASATQSRDSPDSSQANGKELRGRDNGNAITTSSCARQCDRPVEAPEIDILNLPVGSPQLAARSATSHLSEIDAGLVAASENGRFRSASDELAMDISSQRETFDGSRQNQAGVGATNAVNVPLQSPRSALVSDSKAYDKTIDSDLVSGDAERSSGSGDASIGTAVMALEQTENGSVAVEKPNGSRDENHDQPFSKTIQAEEKKVTTGKSSQVQRRIGGLNKQKRKSRRLSSSDSDTSLSDLSDFSDEELLPPRRRFKRKTCLGSGDASEFQQHVNDIRQHLRKRRSDRRDSLSDPMARLLQTDPPNTGSDRSHRALDLLNALGTNGETTSLSDAVGHWWKTMRDHPEKNGKVAIAELSSLLTYSMFFSKPREAPADRGDEITPLKQAMKETRHAVTMADVQVSEEGATGASTALSGCTRAPVAHDYQSGGRSTIQGSVSTEGQVVSVVTNEGLQRGSSEQLPVQGLSSPGVFNLSGRTSGDGENPASNLPTKDRRELWSKAEKLFQLLMKIPQNGVGPTVHECHLCGSKFKKPEDVYVHVIEDHFGERNFHSPGVFKRCDLNAPGTEDTLNISTKGLGTEMSFLMEMLVREPKVPTIDLLDDSGCTGSRTFPMYRPIVYNYAENGFGKGVVLKCGWCLGGHQDLSRTFTDIKTLSQHIDRDHAEEKAKALRKVQLEMQKKTEQSSAPLQNVQQSSEEHPSMQQSSVQDWNTHQKTTQQSTNTQSSEKPTDGQKSSSQQPIDLRASLIPSKINQTNAQHRIAMRPGIQQSNMQSGMQDAGPKQVSMQRASTQQPSMQNPKESNVPVPSMPASQLLRSIRNRLQVQQPSSHQWSMQQQGSVQQQTTSLRQSEMQESSSKQPSMHRPGEHLSRMEQASIEQPGSLQASDKQPNTLHGRLQQLCAQQSHIVMHRPKVQEASVHHTNSQLQHLHRSTRMQQPGTPQPTLQYPFPAVNANDQSQVFHRSIPWNKEQGADPVKPQERAQQDVSDHAAPDPVKKRWVGIQIVNESDLLSVSGEMDPRALAPQLRGSENTVRNCKSSSGESVPGKMSTSSLDDISPQSGRTDVGSVSPAPLSSVKPAIVSLSVPTISRPLRCTACPEISQSTGEICSHYTKVPMPGNSIAANVVALKEGVLQGEPKVFKCSMCALTFASAAESTKHFAKAHMAEVYERQRQLQIDRLYNGISSKQWNKK